MTGQVLVDRGGGAGAGRPQASFAVAPHPHSSTTRREPATLHRQEEGHAFCVQQPIYFVSEVFSESKVHYPSIQKQLYAILITSRKLHQYFDEYKISVVTDFSLVDILHNRDATGRISKWAVELGLLHSTSSLALPSSRKH
jgi:hypothetical protein